MNNNARWLASFIVWTVWIVDQHKTSYSNEILHENEAEGNKNF